MKDDKLVFPVDRYSLEHRTIKTNTGEVDVEFRRYEHICYVAKPIDPEYQSMDVEVPVRLNGRTIDVSGAPILLAVRVGAYMQTRCGGQPTDFMPPPGASGKLPFGGPGGHDGPGRLGMAPPPLPEKKGDKILDLALAAGYVVVRPGNRGRGNIGPGGKRFGKAPATIVDLKSVVRYIRHNKGRFPGDPEHIITNGLSAGGAMSALLGASGNSPLYDEYFAAVGAAEERDEAFAHFTDFSAKRDGETVREDVKRQALLMNPMPFILEGSSDCAQNWWIRLGTLDNGMSFTVAGNLAAALEKRGKDVDFKFYWDAGHYTDLDPNKFIDWVNGLTGYSVRYREKKSMLTLEGRTAVVTGASGTVARAVVRELVENGMNVAVCTHGVWMAERTIEDLRLDKEKCLPLGCETGDPADMKAKLAQVAERFGGIDVLITLHGRSPEYREQEFDTLEPDYVDLTLSNHLTGCYNLLREALPYLEKSRAGRVIFTATSEARTGAANDAMGVTMAKGGTISLTYSAARRLAPKGITVNCIAMGGILNMPGGGKPGGPSGPGGHGGPSGPNGGKPGMNPSWIQPEDIIDTAKIPVGRAGRPEDVAAAVCYLVSEEAGYVTGEVMNVSGGLCMG